MSEFQLEHFINNVCVARFTLLHLQLQIYGSAGSVCGTHFDLRLRYVQLCFFFLDVFAVTLELRRERVVGRVLIPSPFLCTGVKNITRWELVGQSSWV